MTEEEQKMVREDDILLWRMLFLYIVAEYSRRARGQKERALLGLEQPASPKEYLPTVVSWWDTDDWQKLKTEFHLEEVTFNQGSLGSHAVKPTTFGGNLDLRVEDHMTGLRKSTGVIKSSKDLSRWAPGLMRVLAEELMRRTYGSIPKVKGLSWDEHIRYGHVPYRRDCRVCQESLQQCDPHRKVKHVQGGVLSLDTSGPLLMGKDQSGLQARWMLVGTFTWRVPRGSTKMMDTPEMNEDVPEDAPEIEAMKNEDVGGQEEIPEEVDEEDKDLEEPPPKEVEESPPKKEEDCDEGSQGRLEEETEVRVFRMGLPMVTKTSREVTATAMDFILKLKLDGYHVARVHTDQGHEFQGHFRRWARSRGIIITKTPGDDPRSNGRVECAVRVLKTMVRRALRHANAPAKMWPWALRHVNEVCRCVRLASPPEFPPFLEPVRVRKRTWKKDGLEPNVGKVAYLCPSTEDHGHWIQKNDEAPRLTKSWMRRTVEPVSDEVWIAVEKEMLDALSARRRLTPLVQTRHH